MAKVYDALRRAEAERKNRSSSDLDAGAVARLDWEPESPNQPAPAVPAAREPFYRRLPFFRRGSRDETAGDLNKRRISLLQPDSFVLATVLFDVLIQEEAPTTFGLSQTVLGDGIGGAIVVDPVAPLEFEIAIPEVSGIHVFGIGLLVALAGHWLRPAVRMDSRQGS